jgi:glutamate formiminotransferase
MVLECVLNVSEGRDPAVLVALDEAAGPDLLDRHTDEHHHRSVLTLAGEQAARRVSTAALARVSLTAHDGVHPRLGVVDVVPFVPLAGSTMADAVVARDRYAAWLVAQHAVPVFRYGPERSLPEVRRRAFRDLSPDLGPSDPHPTAGATCVGARPVLVAYNVWLDHAAVDDARAIARAIRRPELRALGLLVGDRAQVSMNLVEARVLGPAQAYDLVAAHLPRGAAIERAELVGLLPSPVLEEIDRARWSELDVAEDRTIEARLARRDGT